MSVVTRAECPHKRGAFVWLGDGPWLGDPSDPHHGGYPWVHDTTRADGLGKLEVCELMPFARPQECGEVCACGHASGWHEAAPGPIPAGPIARPRACRSVIGGGCGCPGFRHWADGKPMYATRLACGCETVCHHRLRPGDYLSCGNGIGHQSSYRVESVTPVAVDLPLPSEPVQLALFGGVR